jgi:hypothetical protein
VEAFTRLHHVTSAAGVVADGLRLLHLIGSHDLAGVLTEVIGAAQE